MKCNICEKTFKGKPHSYLSWGQCSNEVETFATCSKKCSDKDELETRQWVLLGTEQLEERIYQKLDELLMSDDRDNIFAMVEEIKRCEIK